MIQVTESAQEYLTDVLKDKNNDDYVTLGVKGGGCSGLSYTLDFDDRKRKFDLTYVSNGITILVDKKSNLYIGKTEIDWSYNLMDRGLKFNNPHAKGSCGCKTSFMIDIPDQEEKIPSWM